MDFHQLVATYTIDWFTIYHFLLWSCFGALLFWILECRVWTTVIVGLGLGLGWEVYEALHWEAFFNFHEPFWNRWLTDPIADVSGIVFGRWICKLWKRLTD